MKAFEAASAELKKPSRTAATRSRCCSRASDPHSPALPAVRPAAGGVSQVRHLPDLLPQHGQRWPDSGRQESELVREHSTMMTDPIADMLTRIRNANRIERPAVDMPATKLKAQRRPGAQGRGLHPRLPGRQDGTDEQGHTDVSAGRGRDRAARRCCACILKYGPEGERVIRHIERASKPGRRLYRRHEQLRPVLDGLGISHLSTSRGVMSDRQARAAAAGRRSCFATGVVGRGTSHVANRQTTRGHSRRRQGQGRRRQGLRRRAQGQARDSPIIRNIKVELRRQRPRPSRSTRPDDERLEPRRCTA